MRKVKFKKWIPAEWEVINHEVLGKIKELKKGTNCWEDDYLHDGVFHQWGAAYEEFETGPGNYTVAIIEQPDGTITEVLPSNLKFEF